MHFKKKSSFFLGLSAIVLSACGGAASSAPSTAPSGSTTSSPSSETSTGTTATLTFVSKGGSAVAPVTTTIGGTFAAPTAPTRPGYRFGGWFLGRAGLTWLDPEPVTFPVPAVQDATLYAYWEPLDSKAVNYGPGETYVSTISTQTDTRLNPTTYLWSHENALMEDMSTLLYSTEVDWDKAIAQGVADFVGDFSKIESREFSIDALDFHNILIGARSFPKDNAGEDFTIDGRYDRLVAAQTSRTEWTFELRDDIFFEDGRIVDASVVEYSLKQYLDPLQGNRRADSYYRRPGTQDGGVPILNADQYRFQTSEEPVSWDSVGFSIVNQFTFKITLWQAISQAAAVGFGNIRLVHPENFQASLTDGVNSTYGTPANPFMSYGPYIIKSWDDNQRMVLNKNFNYVRRDLVTYKSVAYEFTGSPSENVQLFEAGVLSATGLIGDDFTRYAEDPGIRFAWSGFPQYMIINTAPSRNAGEGAYIKSGITADARFRQALFFAIDRETYNSTIYTPNAPSVLPVPVNIKAYLEDPLFYSESPQHLANLEEFGIPAGTNGYLPDRARQLFEAALADYRAENPGSTGPINLRLIILDSPLNNQLATFMKAQLESTFNTPGQQDKLIVNIVASPQATHNANTGNWDFDLALTNLGFGSSTGVQWQYGAIAFIARLLFGTTFGLHLPIGPDGTDLRADPNSFFNQPLNIDLSVTLDYLESLGEDFIYAEDEDGDEELPGHIQLYEALLADPDTGKARGIYTGNIFQLAFLMYALDTPYDAARSAPFPGATQEVWNIVQALERVFFQQIPMIPTSTLQSAVIYQPNVIFLWPAYSVTFGWGAVRYRYLNTDPDFADGMFNAFEAAFLASQTA